MMAPGTIPALATERLILRGPEAGDFEPLATFFAEDPRARGFGGPLRRPEAWRWFAGSIGHWALRGFGFWTVTGREDGRVLGICGLWQPEGWPEPELCWVAFAEAEGRGLMSEAAHAVRAHAHRVLGLPALCSNIYPGNTRSIALARRLGARLEHEQVNVRGEHELVFRHPAPERLGLELPAASAAATAARPGRDVGRAAR